MNEASAVIKPIYGYFVSADGRVFSEKYGRRVELKQSEHKGYRRVCLSNENRRQHYPVHRLVAEAFIPNPDNKPFVNHKDGNKRNNLSHNLEWVTASENQRHAYGELGIRNGHTGYRYTKLYPNEELRSRLVELGVPRWKHNLAELGEMLPVFIGKEYYKLEICNHTAGGWIVSYYNEQERRRLKSVLHAVDADTEADARAQMLIYLIDNNLTSA